FGTEYHGASFFAHHDCGRGRFTGHPAIGWCDHHHSSPYFGYGSGYGGWTISVYWTGGPYPADGPVPPPTDPSAGSAVIGSMSLAEYDARFPEKGEDAFRDGDYEGAVYYWRHALLDDPQNPVLVMMLGQALFATGVYNEAAGATQAAMH